jgi:magnesium-transporting ATPase (P-type)
VLDSNAPQASGGWFSARPPGDGSSGPIALCNQPDAPWLRGRQEASNASLDLVPGDRVLLSAVCRPQTERELFLDEAALTGENLPVAKSPAAGAAHQPIHRSAGARGRHRPE